MIKNETKFIELIDDFKEVFPDVEIPTDQSFFDNLADEYCIARLITAFKANTKKYTEIIKYASDCFAAGYLSRMLSIGQEFENDSVKLLQRMWEVLKKGMFNLSETVYTLMENSDMDYNEFKNARGLCSDEVCELVGQSTDILVLLAVGKASFLLGNNQRSIVGIFEKR